jgi:hypothetical protein
LLIGTEGRPRNMAADISERRQTIQNSRVYFWIRSRPQILGGVERAQAVKQGSDDGRMLREHISFFAGVAHQVVEFAPWGIDQLVAALP